MMLAVEGPAIIDIGNSEAHKTPRCRRFLVRRVASDVASSGPLLGFVWCPICAHLPFEDWPVSDANSEEA